MVNSVGNLFHEEYVRAHNDQLHLFLVSFATHLAATVSGQTIATLSRSTLWKNNIMIIAALMTVFWVRRIILTSSKLIIRAKRQ